MLDKKVLELLDALFEGAYIVNDKRQIIYWNKGSERITGFKKDEVVKKFCYNNILQHVDNNGKSLCHDGCPLLDTLLTGKASENNIFLHHKNGHRVPITVRTSPIYNETGEIVAALEVFTDRNFRNDVVKENRKLKKLVVTDPLTEIYNRRYIDFQLKGKIEQSKEFNQTFGVLFIDIDKFKGINDFYGHDIGDEVLKVVSKTINGNLRNADIFGRWGGEEFVVISESTTENDLEILAEKLRVLVEMSTFVNKDEVIRVTISIGATLYKENDDVTLVISRADKAMYESKETGRNKFTIY